jgi:hypothetical protein
LALGQHHGQQLPPTRDQRCQVALRIVGERPDVVCNIRLAGQRVGEGREGRASMTSVKAQPGFEPAKGLSN